MKRVTIKDVAAAAGVSFSAVSRAFQEDGKASEATRQKVLEAAKLLGYRPSPMARGLVRAKSRLVTLLTGPTQSVFDALFFDALASGLAARGRHLMVAVVRSEDEVADGLMQAVDYQSEAVVVSAGTMSLELSNKCTEAGVPVILSGRVLEAPGVDCVLAENVEGGRQAGSLLARVCDGRLAFFGQGGRTFADRERQQGFFEALAATGRTAETFAVTESGNADDMAMTLLSQPERPAGVFCSNDGLAIALLQAALLLGLRVPEDLSVIGFDNVPQAAWPAFGLTSVDYPVAALVEAIIERIEVNRDDSDEPKTGSVQRIPTRLVVRQTTANGLSVARPAQRAGA